MTEHIDDVLGIMRKLRPGKRCVVSHPDAGGQCERPATMTVWNLEFCEAHGAEAEESAFEEITEGAAVALEALTDAERSRLDSNNLIVRALEWAEIPGRGVGAARSHVDAIREAYPPVEGRVDADTLMYDYGDPMGDQPGDGDGPVEWWTDSHLVMTRAMREAHAHGLAGLLKDLEYVRERAAAQVVQSEADMERRWIAPRLAAKGESLEEWREKMGRQRGSIVTG